MKTGYITPYSTVDARSQVIVVVYEDWTVLCYDSSLHLMWTKEVAHKTFDVDHLIKYYKIHTASLYIAPLQIRDDASPGTVIVGASMTRRSAMAGVTQESELITLRRLSEGTHPDSEAVAKLGHFSIFALDSFSGHVLWKHDGTEIRSEQYSRSLPQHAYTLNLKDLMTKTHHAAGINDWSVFRQSLLDELPHTWTGPEHTSMRIAHFIRRHIGATVGQPQRLPRHKGDTNNKKKGVAGTKRGEHKDTTSGSGRNGRQATGLSALPLLQGEVHSPSLSKAAVLPHNAAEHTQNPNVVVLHTDKGLEVIALRTGIPITSLALPAGKVYADVDGDGVIDTIAILDSPRSVNQHRNEFAHHQFEYAEDTMLQHCMVVVMSGLPARSQLFNGTICSERPSLRESFSDHSESRHHSLVREPPILYSKDTEGVEHRAEHPTIAHAIPLVLRKLDQHLMKESKVKDVVVAIHTGVVTSYTGTGNFNWQMRTAPRWSADDEEENTLKDGEKEETKHVAIAAAVVAFDSDAERASGIGGHDSVYSNILIIGESEMQLISREGEGLTHAELPKPPIAAPVLGDFDNDGVSDIVVVTDGAVLGYHVHVVKASNSVLIVLIALSSIAAVVFILSIQRVDPGAGGSKSVPASILERQSASAAAAMSGGYHTASRVPRSKAGVMGGMFQIVRSTDEQHLD